MDRQFDTLYAYLALARRPGQTAEVGDRTRLMVRELAAERSGCPWCLAKAQHDWRNAGLPVDLLSQLARHETSSGLTEADRAALALRLAHGALPAAPWLLPIATRLRAPALSRLTRATESAGRTALPRA